MPEKSHNGAGARNRNRIGSRSRTQTERPESEREQRSTAITRKTKPSDSEVLSKGLVTALVVGAGALIFEAELIPGILIGAGAVLAPRLFRGLGESLRPLAKGVVRAGYAAATKSRELAEQAREEIDDVVAEARAEQDLEDEQEEEEGAHGEESPSGRVESVSARHAESRRG